MQIIDLNAGNEHLARQVAEMLVEAFREHHPDAWPTLEDALNEVRESWGEGRFSRVAVDEQGAALGWVGGISEYDGKAWELHPLVVKPSEQGQGIGRALVQDFEEQARLRGGFTAYLGTDDENFQTTLGGVDLFQPDPWTHINSIRNLKSHPYEFYQKQGYVIVGVMPDANGPGKPDIIMAKRLQ